MGVGDDMKKVEKELILIDQSFCKASQINKEQAWDEYMSKSVLMGTSKHEPYLDNKNQIIKLIGMIYQLDQISFTWEPTYAFVSDDETLGVTTGTYTRTYLIEEEEYEEIGKYVTTWKKEQGQWKIVFDIGN
jgi:hypothetical protein